MQKINKGIYAVLSGLLLAFSWPAVGWGPLILLAWVPLLLLEEDILHDGKRHNNLRVFAYSLLSFLIWNCITTWWIVNASLGGALLAIVANSMIMAGIFSLFHSARKRIPSRHSVYMLPVFWLAFEFLHFDWDLSWPWLTLGNAFAEQYQLIQWYEFTGTSGGSLWILLLNCMFFQILKNIRNGTPAYKPLKHFRRAILWILLPAVFSILLYFLAEEKGSESGVVIVQPNVDPYGEKFDEARFDDQLEKLIKLALSKTDSSTQWIIGPETALAGSMNERDLPYEERITTLKNSFIRYPDVNLLLGAETHRFFTHGEKRPMMARELPGNIDIHYVSYNSALLINRKGISVYHKSKLVPGVEQMPFPSVFRFVEKLAIDLGGTTGTLGTQDERSVMKGLKENQVAAPAICYESVFGDFFREYIANGATFIAVITNDGWWGDTPGYKQHLAYSRLRAIENRRDIVRSANTGISAIINQRGDIIQSTGWWKPAVIKGTIRINESRTIFSLTGDLLGRSALWMSGFILAWIIYNRFRPQSKTRTDEEGKPQGADVLS